MRGLYVAVAVLFFTSAVTAGGYGYGGHRQEHHGNIYGHNIIRTFPTQHQYQSGRQMYFHSPIRNQVGIRNIGHQNPMVTYQDSGVMSHPAFVNSGFTGVVRTSGVILQQPQQTIYQSAGIANPRTLGVPNNVGTSGISFLSAGVQGVPFQSPGGTPFGSQGVSFQAPGGVPVSPQGGFPIGVQSTTFQATNGLLSPGTPGFPIGIANGSPIVQNGAIANGVVPIGAQPTFDGIQTSATGNVQNNLGFRNLGLNLPITSNAGFDSVPQAYVQEQGGLKTGVPTLGSPFSTEEQVGIPEFGGWAPPGVNSVAVREDYSLPIDRQHISLASILRKFHMK